MSTLQQEPMDTGQIKKRPSLSNRIRNWRSGPHKTWQSLNRIVAAAHPSVKEVGERSRAGLQAWIAVTLGFLFFIGVLASSVASGTFGVNGIVLFTLAIVMVVAYGLSRSPNYGWGGWLITGSVVLAGYGIVLTGQGSTTSLNSFIPLAFILGSILLSPLALLFWVVTGVSGMFLVPSSFGLDVGTASGIFLTLGAMLLVSVVFRNSVERDRLSEVRSANESLMQLQGELEQRVTERTRALTASTEVSRRLSTILDPKQLVKEVVEQVQDAFDFYHVHIYLLDEASGDLIMAGGTGEAGAAMLARGHKISKGRGLVGRTAETNAPVLVPDTSKDINWLPNPLLPDTKSEVAVPISISDNVMGVLDVQQNIVAGLKEEDVVLLQSIANQVAIAVRNARSYEESRSQAELETLVNTIGQKIQRAGTVEDVLQTAIREVGMALGASRVSATLQPVRTAMESHSLAGGNGADPKR